MDGRFVFFKVPETDTSINVDISSLLDPGETLTNVLVGTPEPGTNPALTATLTSDPTNPKVVLLTQGGRDGVSYGVNLTVTTQARTFVVVCAITAKDPSFVPYTTENPEAFTDLVDTIEAGNAAIATSVYTFPAETDPTGGFVVWELLAADGTVYAAGNAFSYTVQSDGLSHMVVAQSVVSIPTTVPPSLEGQKYQLRYTLELPQDIGIGADPLTGTPGQNRFYQFENVRVVGLNTVPLGTQPQVELKGVPATLSICVDKPYDNVTLEIWIDGNQVAAQTPITDYERTANGYVFSGVVSTSDFAVTLIPYTVVWKYWASNNAANVVQESADLWIINPSIMTAITDVKAKINKARTTLYGTPDLLYPHPTILTWLRRGMDAFNGAYGKFTNFTMTNARGVIREFWLLEAEMAALQSQFLAEGEKAFEFQGAAISLNVDRTRYLDEAQRIIQQRLDNELRDIKINLIIKGQTSGDGSQDPTRLAQGAIGAVGVTITPASAWGRFSPAYGVARGAVVANSY
ncbi:head-tail connector protein [Burkholderia phage BcepSaruman]|uniref:Uncharacterized protein n=1 Tax=Burkholderia phage BcepSaruman TaxID=2530032 RepID=A0A4D5ZD88_9CAUD|nr:head-tail connector protein [Burkholderia phage BcepSaruman]QBX06506.1 hypothetical protein BcepSaruman_093 [Burkholderia phage BcepSaruman]